MLTVEKQESYLKKCFQSIVNKFNDYQNQNFKQNYLIFV